MGNFSGNLEDPADQGIISGRQIQSRTDMLARHDEDMMWCLGVDIFESNQLDFGGGPYTNAGFYDLYLLRYIP